MDRVKNFQNDKIRTDLPELFIGDSIKVYVKIIEGEKKRIQPFEGTLIAKRSSGLSETFTVRRISYGEGVERTFLRNSPFIDKIDITRKGVVKRAKLYYLRDRVGKKTKVKEKIVATTKKSS